MCPSLSWSLERSRAERPEPLPSSLCCEVFRGGRGLGAGGGLTLGSKLSKVPGLLWEAGEAFLVIDLLNGLSEPESSAGCLRGSLWDDVNHRPLEARGLLSMVLNQNLAVGRQSRGSSVGLRGTYGSPGGALLPVLVAAGHAAGQMVWVP